MARPKLKRGKWAEPHDPMQIRISGPTDLYCPETGVTVGREYRICGRYRAWTATRILKNHIEFQANHSGKYEKFPKRWADGFREITT